MLNIIQDNLSSILVAIAVIVGLIFLYKAGKKEMVKKVVLDLVVKAELAFGNGTGELKYAEVVAGIYDKLPAIVIFFLSQKEIDSMIEGAVCHMKKMLAKGKNLA